MAILFHEQTFINSLLEKAKEYRFDITYELEQFKKYHQLEYLFLVKKYVEALRENELPVTLRMRGASSQIAYLLGIHRINPVQHSLSSTLFFEMEYKDGGLGPRFDVCVPWSHRDYAIELLNDLLGIDIEKSGGSLCGSVFFLKRNPNYRIGVLGNVLLDRLVDVVHDVDHDDNAALLLSYDFSELNNKECLKFMLQEKRFKKPGVYNLNRCIHGSLPRFYELMEAGKPQDLYDLAIINCLNRGIFVSKKKLISFIKENGLKNVIYDQNQLLDVLINWYYMSTEVATELIYHAFHDNRLSERDELILDSLGVPKNIQEQMTNIKFLYSMPASMEEMKVSYKLAETKYFLPCEFEECVDKHSFIGPFFYINKRLYAYAHTFADDRSKSKFFNAPISHAEYFDSLGIEGDYGNYPRGRVIYDNLHKKFLVYLDKDLMTEDIKKKIMSAYCLVERNTAFKTDEHYTHDDL